MAWSVAETHVSALVFAGDLVFKWKKPVRTEYLDFSTRAARERTCHREVELNRRLAPDVYLGVADLVMGGSALDHAVVMRRLPEEARLSTLVRRGEDVGPALRQLARLLSAFHAMARRSPEIDRFGSAQAVSSLWEANFKEMASSVGPVLDSRIQERVMEGARTYLAGRAPLLASRVERGRVCDGHGDLLAEDIFCLPDGPRVLDCVEFDDRLRYGDVLADLAFLVMDLGRLGAHQAAGSFLRAYEEFSGDRFPSSLVEHYAGYRALVRAKVASLRHLQGDPWGAQAAVTYQRLALSHLERGRVHLVLLGGLPGTGKSTLARALGDERGWVVLRSDEVRKEMAGLDPSHPAPAPWEEGLYTPSHTEATYRALLGRAAEALAMGESVVLDASFADSRWRAVAAKVAKEGWARLVELRCEAPFSETLQRLTRRARSGDASDADAEIARAMSATADPWPSSTTINTWGAIRASLAEVEAVLAEPALVRPAAPGR